MSEHPINEPLIAEKVRLLVFLDKMKEAYHAGLIST
jgi:hypothetical protein